MKTLVLGLVLAGVTNLIQAQEVIAAVDVYKEQPSSTTTTVKNNEYLANFNTDNVSNAIHDFQQYIAAYKVESTALYTPEEPSVYRVTFSEGKNRVEATYNQKGELISCIEKYEDIRLPVDISIDLAKLYAGWEFNKVSCIVRYVQNNTATVTYKVVLKKGNRKKLIKHTA